VSLVSPNVSTRSALQRFAGNVSGIQLGLANALRAFQTEEPQLTPRQQIEHERGKAIPGQVGRVVRIPGRALMAEDEMAKAVAYTGELHRIAMDRAQAANRRTRTPCSRRNWRPSRPTRQRRRRPRSSPSG